MLICVTNILNIVYYEFIKGLSKEDKKSVIEKKSNKTFKFGAVVNSDRLLNG